MRAPLWMMTLLPIRAQQNAGAGRQCVQSRPICTPGADDGTGADPRTGADFGAGADHGHRLNHHARFQPRGRIDVGRPEKRRSRVRGDNAGPHRCSGCRIAPATRESRMRRLRVSRTGM